MTEYEQRQEAKKERYAERAVKLRESAESNWKAARDSASQIPMGQPILVGHHSEKRHRNHLEHINKQEDKAMEDLRKAEHYERKAERIESNTAISSDDPDAVAKLGEKLARMETQRDGIKAENKNARKEGREALPGYVLSNLGNNIRRVKERIRELETKTEATPAEDVEHDGFTITEDTGDNRLRFIFDGKPSAGIRKIMKSNGFRWSPRNGAWQRQLTANARMSAEWCIRGITKLTAGGS